MKSAKYKKVSGRDDEVTVNIPDVENAGTPTFVDGLTILQTIFAELFRCIPWVLSMFVTFGSTMIIFSKDACLDKSLKRVLLFVQWTVLNVITFNFTLSQRCAVEFCGRKCFSKRILQFISMYGGPLGYFGLTGKLCKDPTGKENISRALRFIINGQWVILILAIYATDCEVSS